MRKRTARDESAIVVIETPRGSSHKFKWDKEANAFELKSILPLGFAFPYDFGFFPDTLAPDGDPLDVLLLMDEPVFVGCRVRSRLIGVMEAEQTDKGKAVRNDRVIAVAAESRRHGDVSSLKDLNETAVHEIEQFFVDYQEAMGKKFRVIQRRGPRHSWKLLRESRQAHKVGGKRRKKA